MSRGRFSATFTAVVTGLLLFLTTSSCSSGAPRHDLRIVVMSDLNSSYGSTKYEPQVREVVNLILEQWQPDLVLSAGDLIAAQKPELPDEQVQAMWAAFDTEVALPLRTAGIPFGFTLGNHDGSAHPAHRRDREMAAAHWRAPERHPGVSFIDSTHFPVYYSFSAGEIFVLAWDASYGGTIDDSTMMEWVRRELASEQARGSRYRIVLGHLPLYGVAEGRNRPGEVLKEANSLRRMLERHRVHTYISGHHHAYYPGRNGDVQLLYSGALGQGPRPLIGSKKPPAQTVTILDFHFEADSVAYTTYQFRDGEMSRIESADLPPVIRGFNGDVIRRDLPDSIAIPFDTKSPNDRSTALRDDR